MILVSMIACIILLCLFILKYLIQISFSKVPSYICSPHSSPDYAPGSSILFYTNLYSLIYMPSLFQKCQLHHYLPFTPNKYHSHHCQRQSTFNDVTTIESLQVNGWIFLRIWMIHLVHFLQCGRFFLALFFTQAHALTRFKGSFLPKLGKSLNISS